MLAFALVIAGLAGWSVFAWCVWPPLALLPFSLAAVGAGLLVDWGKLSGKPSTTPSRTD